MISITTNNVIENNNLQVMENMGIGDNCLMILCLESKGPLALLDHQFRDHKILPIILSIFSNWDLSFWKKKEGKEENILAQFHSGHLLSAALPEPLS